MNVNDWQVRCYLALIAILVLFAVWAGGVAYGRTTARTQPVYHAPTEDSVILDCDFRNHGWYQKG